MSSLESMPQSSARNRKQPLKMLVTGASGFVGSHVVRAALGRGHEVVAAVRSRSRAARLDGVSSGLRFVEVDLSNGESMRRAATDASPDVAVHLGWSIGPDYLDSPDNLTCVGGSLALLQGLVEVGCPRILFVGSHLELAPDEGELDEGSPVDLNSLYALCKDSVHRIARTYVENAGSSFVWARLFNIYGPGQADWALVPYIIQHLLDGRRCPMTHGTQQRTFLHVDDVGEALLDTAQSSIRGVVHIGSADVETVRELALRIGNQLERPELLSFGELAPNSQDAPRIVPSTTRLFSEVGFQPHWSLDEGLTNTIDWWRTNHKSVVAT